MIWMGITILKTTFDLEHVGATWRAASAMATAYRPWREANITFCNIQVGNAQSTSMDCCRGAMRHWCRPLCPQHPAAALKFRKSRDTWVASATFCVMISADGSTTVFIRKCRSWRFFSEVKMFKIKCICLSISDDANITWEVTRCT